MTSSTFAANFFNIMDAKSHPRSFKEARIASGMSQEAVADAIGLTRQAIAHWENREVSPTGPARQRLSQIFDLPMDVVDGWFSRDDRERVPA